MPYDKIHVIRKMLELGLITRDTLTRVLLICKYRNINVVNVLANYAGMSIDEIRRFAEEHFDVPSLDLSDVVLNPEIVRMVPSEVAMQLQMVPAFRISNRMHLAVTNPFDFDGINRIKEYIGETSNIFMAPEIQVVQAISKYQAIREPEGCTRTAADRAF